MNNQGKLIILEWTRPMMCSATNIGIRIKIRLIEQRHISIDDWVELKRNIKMVDSIYRWWSIEEWTWTIWTPPLVPSVILASNLKENRCNEINFSRKRKKSGFRSVSFIDSVQRWLTFIGFATEKILDPSCFLHHHFHQLLPMN